MIIAIAKNSIKIKYRFLSLFKLFFFSVNKNKANLETITEQAIKKNLLEFRLYLFASSKSPFQHEVIPLVNPHELHCKPLIS